jgi:hypothetical protein
VGCILFCMMEPTQTSSTSMGPCNTSWQRLSHSAANVHALHSERCPAVITVPSTSNPEISTHPILLQNAVGTAQHWTSAGHTPHDLVYGKPNTRPPNRPFRAHRLPCSGSFTTLSLKRAHHRSQLLPSPHAPFRSPKPHSYACSTHHHSQPHSRCAHTK